MKKYTKELLSTPFSFILIILFIVFAVQVQGRIQLNNSSEPGIIYGTIILVFLSSLTAANNFFRIYLFLILLHISALIDYDYTLEAFCYAKKENFYYQKVIKKAYLQILTFICLLIVIAYALLFLNGSFPVTIAFFIHTIVGMGSILLFYGLFINIYLLLLNFNFNKYIALVLVAIFGVLSSGMDNIFTKTLVILISNIDMFVDIKWIIIIFYGSLNILMVELNAYLFGKKDIR